MYAELEDSTQRNKRPQSFKLAAVKHDLYHPRLPTLRRMDMDSIGHKLPSEHSRCTTPCTRDQFEECRGVPYSWGNYERNRRLHCLNYIRSDTQSAVTNSKPIPLSTSKALSTHRQRWNETKRKLDAFEQEGSLHVDKQELQVSDYFPTRGRPGLMKSWQVFSRHHASFTKPRPVTVAVSSFY